MGRENNKCYEVESAMALDGVFPTKLHRCAGRLILSVTGVRCWGLGEMFKSEKG